MSFTTPEKVLLPEDANESSNFISVNMLWWSVFLTVMILSPSLILPSGEMLVRIDDNFFFWCHWCIFDSFFATPSAFLIMR